ncbi:MAG TPA: hypothetical protein VHE99_11905 [Gammaproteobacteria bacterium]|nr:hypothetical protein [Gammaproteobacteria bacterium]
MIIGSFIFSLHIPLLIDFPNHLARMYLNHNLDQLPYSQTFYYRKFAFVPYLGMDVLFDFFLRFFDIYTVGKILIVLSMVGIVASVLYLSKVIHGRYETSTFLVYTVIFNAVLYWGFINYYITIPMTIAIVAVWIQFENKKYKQLLIFFVLSQILYFAHLLAFLMLVLIIGTYEVQKNNFSLIKSIKKIIQLSVYFLACCIIPIVNFILVDKLLDSGYYAPLRLGKLVDKLYALLSPFYFGSFIIAGLFIFLFAIAYLNKTLILKKNHFLILMLFLFSLLMPRNFNGVFGLHLRLPIITAILFFTMSRFNAYSQLKIRVSKYALCGFTAFVMIFYAQDLRKSDQFAIAYINSLKLIPSGARILVITHEYKLLGYHIWRLYHIQSLAVIERQAFEPTLFNNMPPIQTKPQYIPSSNLVGIAPNDKLFVLSEIFPQQISQVIGKNFYWKNWPRDYDYIDYIHGKTKIDLGSRVGKLKIIYQDSLHTIYQINPFLTPTRSAVE